jgi:hypothetical protein
MPDASSLFGGQLKNYDRSGIDDPEMALRMVQKWEGTDPGKSRSLNLEFALSESGSLGVTSPGVTSYSTTRISVSL